MLFMKGLSSHKVNLSSKSLFSSQIFSSAYIARVIAELLIISVNMEEFGRGDGCYTAGTVLRVIHEIKETDVCAIYCTVSPACTGITHSTVTG